MFGGLQSGRVFAADRRCARADAGHRRQDELRFDGILIDTGEGRSIRGQLQQAVDRFVSPTLTEGGLLKLDLCGELPTDPAVREAVLKRQLVAEPIPGCAASRAIGALADKLLA